MSDVSPQTIFGWSPLILSCTVMVASYALIVSERLNRAIVALLGAGLMIITGVIDQDQAFRGIDFNTIGLLIGMMVLVAVMKDCGVFQYVAIKAVKAAGGRPWGILVMLATITAILSALLDNVTTVLLVAPVTLLIADELQINPYPLLFAEINASNSGGTATLIGDPPNIMIGSAAGLTFNDFVLNLAPLVVVVFLATLVPLWFIYGRHLTIAEGAASRLLAFNENEAITDWRLLRQSLTVFGGVITAFVLARPFHLEPATIALCGAGVLLLLVTVGQAPDHATRRLHAVFSEVEWVTIFFFCGLFVIVAGVEHAGLLTLLAEETLRLTGGDLALTSMAVLWVSALASAVVDNIPFVATMIPLLNDLMPGFQSAATDQGRAESLWWALAAGACLGGNGTLIGASANLVVAGIAERNGVPFRFLPFLKVAFPIMLLQVAIGGVYLWLRYL